jgi:response regulator RpfG family c-di-GMP phosphodiesterase
MTPIAPSTAKLNLAEIYSRLPGGTPARPALKPTVAKSEARGVVLLLEKDNESAEGITRVLHREAYQVLRATTIAEADRLIASTAIDFLLARREACPVTAEADLLLKKLNGKTAVRIVNRFSDLVLNPQVDHDKMTRGFMAALDFLVAQLEGNNPTVRGHSCAVAKYCWLVGQRMGLGARDLDELNAAAYLHDLASLIQSRTFTKVTQDRNGAQLPGYEKTVDHISQLPLPFNVSKLLLAASRPRHVAEPGSPAPPLTARILRIADVYDTLRRTNPETNEEEAFFHWMRGQPSGTFDTQALETFIHLRKSERMLSTMDMFQAKVLIIDPNPEEVKDLQLRLENDDRKVRVVSSLDAAMQVLATESVTVVISEFRLPGGDDGLQLLRSLKVDPSYQSIPFLFHASADATQIRQALELGAEDWLAKPHNVDIVAVKVDRLIHRLRSQAESQVAGVRGSLGEMGLIEMVQILGAANRSVHIQLERNGASAELFVHQGKIIAATMGDLVGNQAAIEILLWENGNFGITPLKAPPPANVTMSTDNLVMESCLQKDTRIHAASNGNGNGNGTAH